MTKKSDIINMVSPIHQSGLACYKACPLKFKYRFIDGIEPSYRHSAALFGSAIHSCLNLMLTRSMDIDLESEFLKALDYAVQESSVPVFWKDTREKNLQNALEILSEFRAYWKENPAEVIYSEVTFRCKIFQVDFEGIIDLVTYKGGEYHLIDFKTSKQKPNEAFLKQSTQLNLYAFVLKYGELYVDGKWIKPRITVSKFGWFFLRSLERYKRKVPGREIGDLKGEPRMFVEVVKEDFKIFKKDLKNLLHSVLKPYWFPNENHCSMCGFSDLCLARAEQGYDLELSEQHRKLIGAIA